MSLHHTELARLEQAGQGDTRHAAEIRAEILEFDTMASGTDVVSSFRGRGGRRQKQQRSRAVSDKLTRDVLAIAHEAVIRAKRR